MGIDALTSSKQRLLTRREELQTRLAELRSALRRDTEPLTPDFADQAVQRENDEVMESLCRSSEIELGQIGRALDRIESGHYGRCVACGQAIEPGRLRLVPYALRCGQCAAAGTAPLARRS